MSGSDDNVASILVFVVVVYICILIGVCVCICAILEEAVVPYPALDGALPHITIPPNHLPPPDFKSNTTMLLKYFSCYYYEDYDLSQYSSKTAKQPQLGAGGWVVDQNKFAPVPLLN